MKWSDAENRIARHYAKRVVIGDLTREDAQWLLYRRVNRSESACKSRITKYIPLVRLK